MNIFQILPLPLFFFFFNRTVLKLHNQVIGFGGISVTLRMEECYYSITISLENIKIININESEKSVVEKGNYSLL